MERINVKTNSDSYPLNNIIIYADLLLNGGSSIWSVKAKHSSLWY